MYDTGLFPNDTEPQNPRFWHYPPEESLLRISTMRRGCKTMFLWNAVIESRRDMELSDGSYSTN
jgi:hypothetical protein